MINLLWNFVLHLLKIWRTINIITTILTKKVTNLIYSFFFRLKILRRNVNIRSLHMKAQLNSTQYSSEKKIICDLEEGTMNHVRFRSSRDNWNIRDSFFIEKLGCACCSKTAAPSIFLNLRSGRFSTTFSYQLATAVFAERRFICNIQREHQSRKHTFHFVTN